MDKENKKEHDRQIALDAIRICGFCGSDHGCSCHRKLEEEDWKDRFYQLKR